MEINEDKMTKILVVGSINMDLVVRVSHSPKPGETVLGSDFATFPGGKGANQAVAASRMGGEVSMVGRVGMDDFGDGLLQELVDNQIKTAHVIKDPTAPTGIAMIAVAHNGENMIVVASGANSKVSVEDVNEANSLMSETDIMLVQMECPLETVTAAIELANVHGLPVILNPAPAQSLSKDILSKVDYLTPNQSELVLLTGEEDLEEGVQKLHSWGVQNIVVTLGSEGAWVISKYNRSRGCIQWRPGGCHCRRGTIAQGSSLWNGCRRTGDHQTRGTTFSPNERGSRTISQQTRNLVIISFTEDNHDRGDINEVGRRSQSIL